VSPVPEQRTISIAAPRESADLARIAGVVDESGISVDEVALRHPTLDDAFLALTGHTAHERAPEAEEAAVSRMTHAAPLQASLDGERGRSA
jgi:hypothetical protein